MLLWRLSGVQFANTFDGGYGLLFNGRWNTVGHAVTYSATSPSLCVLEKLVHVEDPDLLPALVLVLYDVPDALESDVIELGELPSEWRRNETATQQQGDAWYGRRAKPLLRVPSAIVPIDGAPDVNVLINHSHPEAARITVSREQPFVLDPRLF